ncbi:MAG: S8 family serine peptidase [Elusimicrobia bacterium]|nr:S8 family serine peptidase [Elusimicrobiota bacterium]
MSQIFVLFAFIISLPCVAHAYRLERLTGVAGLAVGVSGDVVAEEAMVKFSSTVTSAQRVAALSGIGAGIIQEYPFIGWTWVRLPAGMRVVNGLDFLKNLPGVIVATPNHFYRANRTPNDPLVAQQPSLGQISAYSAWEFETGSSSAVTIVVMDSGIDSTHPDLNAKILSAGASARSQDCSSGACAANDPPTAHCRHGTQVAGVAAAASDNGIGVSGISWGAKLISLKVLTGGVCTPSSDCNSCGAGGTDASVVAALGYATAMQTLADMPAGKIVVNMSLGAPGFICLSDPDGTAGSATAIRDAMQAAVNVGIPVVVSAGNDGGAVNQPANCAGVAPNTYGIIPVGAVDQNNLVASFSSHGPELANYGVAAPGVSIETTMVGNTYTNGVSGTSFAAPHVAGLAALAISARPDCRGLNCAQFAHNTIRGGADSVGAASLSLAGGFMAQGEYTGAGRINAFRSMRLAVRGTLADFEGDQKAIAFPNPFRLSQNPQVSITVPLSLQGAETRIKLYTIAGEFVRELTGLTWDGKNADGNPVATGTYVFVVSSANGTTRGRVAVIR